MFKVKRNSRVFSAASVVVSAAALAVTLAPSAQAATPTDAEITAALQRHNDGTWTQADVDLVRSVPELAAIVPDVTRPQEITTKSVQFSADGTAVDAANGEPLSEAQLAEVMPGPDAQISNPGEAVTTPAETEAAPGAGGFGVRITGGSWKMTHITHTHRSYTGDVIFKYHTYAKFNYAGGKVRAWGERYDDFTNENSSVIQVKIGTKRITDTKSATPASSATSKMKREVDLCVLKYGCYATLHPWAQVRVYGTGSTKIDGSGV
ncbi:hypothetical protein [Streptomyces sp. NPDC089795]|uniref:hypothetical protein n=1 Tax=Streptomyces sp. NPDC089795 TaxID=3155297 RepID=UPI003424E978